MRRRQNECSSVSEHASVFDDQDNDSLQRQRRQGEHQAAQSVDLPIRGIVSLIQFRPVRFFVLSAVREPLRR